MFRPILLPAISIVAITLMAFAHPYHVAVNTITWKKDKKEVGIEIKTFLHDIEHALHQFGNVQWDVKNHDNKAKRDSLVYAYVDLNFKVSINYDDVVYSKDSIGFKDEYMLIYLHVPDVSGGSIMVSNTMCFEIEKTQTNMFNFVSGVNKITKKCVNPSSEMEFKLN